MAKLPTKHTENGKKAIIPQSVAQRRVFLQKELSKHRDKSFFCKSLGVNVLVLGASIDEIAGKACMFKKATELALFLPHILRNAKVMKLHLPTESNLQTGKKFRFVEIATLRCNVKNVGIAKVVIGFRKSGTAIEYCITSYQKLTTKK